MTAFMMANPLMIIMGALIAIGLVLEHAWRHNIFGIRQHFGNFVQWFSGVFDSWIKPTLSAMGTSVIILANTFIHHISNLKNYWDLAWNAMYIIGAKAWNAIVGGISFVAKGIQDFANGLIWLYNLGAGSLGQPLMDYFEIDFSRLILDTSDAEGNITSIMNDIGNSAENTSNVIKDQIGLWNKTLDSVKPHLEDMGDEFIKQGEQIDSGIVKETSILDNVMGGVTSTMGMAVGAVRGLGAGFDTTTQSIMDSTSAMRNFNSVIGGGSGGIGSVAGIMSVSSKKVIYDTRKFSRDTITELLKSYGATLESIKYLGGTQASAYYGGSALNDFIWRPGQGAIAINPQDTLVGTKGGAGGGTVINFEPTITNTFEVTNEVDIDRIKNEMSEEWVEEIKSMMRR